jgi:hypothetical protein
MSEEGGSLIPPGAKTQAWSDRSARGIDLDPGHPVLRREVDAEFHELARLTQLTHHDLFTWALTRFTEWNPDIVEDLDGFIRTDPEDRRSRLAVVDLLLERPEVESYIERILAPLPNTDPDALTPRVDFITTSHQVFMCRLSIHK